jgi:adenosylcobinamide-GDP ribazoletransferase
MLGAAAVMSRAAASFASLTFPSAQGDGLLDTLRGAADRQTAAAIVFSILWFVLAASVALALDWRGAAVITVAILLITLYIRVMSKRQFGGMSGDLAGFLIQLAELSAVVAFVLLEKAEVLL